MAKIKVTIDDRACACCWMCVTFCPEEALSEGHHGPEITGECKVCLKCRKICPVGAIGFKRV